MSEQELDVPGGCLVLRRFHLDSFCFSWGLECGICKKCHNYRNLERSFSVLFERRIDVI